MGTLAEPILELDKEKGRGIVKTMPRRRALHTTKAGASSVPIIWRNLSKFPVRMSPCLTRFIPSQK